MYNCEPLLATGDQTGCSFKKRLLSDEFKASRSIKVMKAVKDALMIYLDTNEVVVLHTKTQLVLDTI